jgi:SNF2 family DNA or RNA helicase
MSQSIKIQTDNENQGFLLTGDIQDLLKNSRLLFSLKRLRYSLTLQGILIPFEERTKIKILQELQMLMDKFSLGVELSQETKEEVSSFDREQRTFKEFSEKARDIRNDRFRDKPELIADFDKFQTVLKDKIVRPLYPLQLLSAFHMAFSQNACNFAVPGAGKTSIVYGAYTYLKSLPEDDPKHVDKLLVIGPLSSFAPWESEYEACFGVKPESQRLSGDNTVLRTHKEQHLFSSNPAELTLIYHGGVDSLQNEIIAFLKKNKTMVVVDEAHRIKNPEGVWGKSAVEIAKEAVSRIVLTGTPVPNGYEDLFNLFQYLYPYKYKEILQSHYDNLVEMTKNSSPDSERVKQFINNISPFFIRIKKTDLKLPPTKEYQIEIEVDPHQREIYDFIETKYVRSFESNSTAAAKDLLNKAKLIRLRQAATNPGLLLKPIAETLYADDYESRISFGGSMPEEFQSDSEILSKIYNYQKTETPKKFREIKKILEEKVFIGNGKAIIWTIFIQNAKQLQQYLGENNIKSQLLIGEIEQSDRESVIKKFNDPDNKDFQVIIANPFAVSESISLHKGCHNAIYMERDYNCSNFLQSKDRIHRYGLPPDQETNYYYVLSKDSIDEVINDRLDEKVKRMERIIDEEIPLFTRLNDSDETDLIKSLIENYAKRT